MFRLFRPITVKSIPIVALFCAALSGCGPRAREKPPSGATRTTIEAIAPKGDVTWPIAFEWKASGGGPHALYRVTVYDAVERQLFERDTRETRWDASGELPALRSSGRRFQWRVAVLDETGSVVAQTGLAEFTTK